MTAGLIVNADDYGLTGGVNRGIEEAHERGVVTSTTVLAAGEAAAAAGDLPRRFPELGIGLHVNLTLGGPASDPALVPTLVDRDGRFHEEHELLRRLLRGRIASGDVRREVLAQAGRLRALGLRPTHFDGHRGIAFWPGVLGPVAAAAKEAGIPAVRSQRVWVVRNGAVGARARWAWRLSRPRRLVGEAARRTASRRLAGAFAMPAWRTATNVVVGEPDDESRWPRLVSSLPHAVCEIVTHPAYPDERLAALTPNLCESRLGELHALTDPGLRERIESRGLRLMTFASL